MTRNGLLMAFAFLAVQGLSAEAQMVVSGSLSASDSRLKPVVQPRRSPSVLSARRLKNPYFAARPIYLPPYQGARANITFEPYTSKYYPTENTYYPPLPVPPTIRSR